MDHSRIRTRLYKADFDPARLQPWLDKNGRSWVTVKDEDGGTKNVLQSERAMLTLEDWSNLDAAAAKGFNCRAPLTRFIQGWSSFSGFNGLQKTEMEYEVHADESVDDAPKFQLRSTPLPITHSDFSVNPISPESRKRGVPVDDTMAEVSGRRVGEAVEDWTVGVSKEIMAGWGGLSNHPHVTKLKATYNPFTDLKAMLAAAKENKFFGPFLFLHNRISKDGRLAIEDRDALALDGIIDKDLPVWPRPADEPESRCRYRLLPEGTMLLAQMTPDVVRIIVGQEPVVVQWEDGFKVLCVIVPQIRSDFYGRCGIVRCD